MELRVLWIGKTKDRNLADLSAEFTRRIRRFLPVEITEIRDVRSGGERQIQDEGRKLLAAIGVSDYAVLLDAGGAPWSSGQFADFLGKHMRSDPRPLTFVIGGYAGVPESVKARADRIWSLSPLTFTHDMTRVLLLEQIYRALAALHHHPYAQ